MEHIPVHQMHISVTHFYSAIQTKLENSESEVIHNQT